MKNEINTGLAAIPEYVVTIPLADHCELIETAQKYNLLVNALLGAIEKKPYAYDDNKLQTNNSVLVVLKALEPVGYNSVVTELLKEKEEPIEILELETKEN